MSDDSPRYNSYETRVHIALQKFHGIGTEDEEGWSQERIANHLNVSEQTVNKYLNHTEQAEEVKASFAETAEQTRQEIISDLRQRLRTLRDLEEQYAKAVEVQVTDYTMKEVRATVAASHGDSKNPTELDIEDSFTESASVPVPAEFEQVPQFDRLRKVWDERRNTEEQLEDLLGLEEPEKHEVSGQVTEQKVYKLQSEEELPEQEVVPATGEADEVDDEEFEFEDETEEESV